MFWYKNPGLTRAEALTVKRADSAELWKNRGLVGTGESGFGLHAATVCQAESSLGSADTSPCGFLCQRPNDNHPVANLKF